MIKGKQSENVRKWKEIPKTSFLLSDNNILSERDVENSLSSFDS